MLRHQLRIASRPKFVSRTIGWSPLNTELHDRLYKLCTVEFPPPPLPAQQPLVGQGLLIIEASRAHSDTPQSVGLLWTNDQSVA